MLLPDAHKELSDYIGYAISEHIARNRRSKHWGSAIETHERAQQQAAQHGFP